MHELTQSIDFQMSLLLFVALLGYLIASIIKQSAVIGQVIMGVLVGPSILGLITYKGLVVELGHLGAVILLFVVGLEFKLKELIKMRSLSIAFSGVILPWISGYFCATVFGYGAISSLFIATALTATSIAITANVLHELGYLKTDIANTIIGAAVIDDILALLALTITIQVSKDSLEIFSIVILTLKSILFLVSGIFVGFFFIRKIISKVDETQFAKKYPEFVFVLAMALAFLYALCSVAVGLSDIIGAFVAGVVLEGMSLKHSRSFGDGADYLRIIFASMFFVSLGVLADIKSHNFSAFIFTIVLTFTAIASKVVGCGLVAKLYQFNWRESAVVGLCMSPRGEVAMVVALFSLQEKAIEQDVYVSLMMMSLITTIIAPAGIKKLLKPKGKLIRKPI